MKIIKNLLAVIFLLTLLPASASAALIVSDWTATPTSLSFKITGTIDEGVPFGTGLQKSRLFIGPSGLSDDAGKHSVFYGTVTSLGGSPTALGTVYGGNPGEQGAYLFNSNGSAKLQMQRFGGEWQTGDILNYSVSFSDSGLYDLSSWDPSGAIVSAGRSNFESAPEVGFQVGSFAPVPDTGSTAALLGAGVVAIAFARRRLG